MKNLLIFLVFVILALMGCSTRDGSKHDDGRSLDAGSDSECGKILDNDLFSKIYVSGTSVERDLAQIRFFASSENEAWNVYRQVHIHDSNESADIGVSVIDVININSGDSGRSTNDFEKFKQAYARAKQLFQQHVNIDNYRNASDTYSSVVNDANSVKAWSDCVVKPSKASKLRVVLRRLSLTSVLAQVQYSASTAVGNLPQLNISFSGGEITDGSPLAISQGSHIYMLTVSENTPHIGVNGIALDGSPIFSFRATLPPTKQLFESTRCRLQNTLMFMSGRLSLPLYQTLESGGYVAFPVSNAPHSHGSESCESWLTSI